MSSPVEAIDVAELLAPHPPRTNVNLFRVDGGYAVRVARVRDAFPWHYHPDHDEAWFVIEGRIRIESEHGDAVLGRGQAALVPRGLKHQVVAVEDLSTVLIVNASTFETRFLHGDDAAGVGYRELELSELERPARESG